MAIKILENKKFLQQCLDIAEVMFIALDRNGIVTLANKKAAEILEVPLVEIVGYNWFEKFIPDSEQKEIQSVFQKILAEKLQNVEYYESNVVTGSGEVKTIAWHNSVLYEQEGQISGILGSGEDITDQKQLSSELIRNELHLHKIFDILPIGLWIADENGKLLISNPAGVKIWGAEPHVGIEEYGIFKAYRLPSHEEILPEDWALAHTIKEGITVENELLEIEAFDGRKKLILNYTAPVIDDNGRVMGAIIVNQDVTEEKQLEQNLAESEERFQLAMQATKDGLFDWNLITNEIYYSAGWKSMLGYSDDEIKNEFSEWERLTRLFNLSN
ncbi:MAG: PAS domain-containing protein [Candidatus Cloacimonetes bacterium]|nr:PAS domain-containing protein [Candidatus Cloacimonadota bacterium]